MGIEGKEKKNLWVTRPDKANVFLSRTDEVVVRRELPIRRSTIRLYYYSQQG
jgi:hypothetical protein